MTKPDSNDEKPASEAAHMGIGDVIYVAGPFAEHLGEDSLLKYDPRTGKFEPVEGK